MYKLKKDKYKSTRGGYSRILEITCEHCSAHICYYQKDGPGMLRRMYLDRMIDHDHKKGDLFCPDCQRLIGVYIIYEKEQRPAYRLFAGSVNKKIAKLNELTDVIH